MMLVTAILSLERVYKNAERFEILFWSSRAVLSWDKLALFVFPSVGEQHLNMKTLEDFFLEVLIGST